MNRYKHINEMERDEDGVLVGNCDLCGLEGIDVEEHVNSKRHQDKLNTKGKKNIHSYESFHLSENRIEDQQKHLENIIVKECDKFYEHASHQIGGAYKALSKDEIIEVLERIVSKYKTKK